MCNILQDLPLGLVLSFKIVMNGMEIEIFSDY